MKKPLADIQNGGDPRGIPLPRVGVREILLPFGFIDADGTISHSTATVSLDVNLSAEKKGVNMSRFVGMLNDFVSKPRKLTDFEPFLDQTITRLESADAQIDLSFDYFFQKPSPVIGTSALFPYQIKVEAKKIRGLPASGVGYLSGLQYANAGHPHTKIPPVKFSLELKTKLTASNCCPCSKEISDMGAHNQRLLMEADVLLLPKKSAEFCLKEFLLDIEQASSSPVYPVLKRPDEKFVTETQYNQPKFVEDVIRDGVIRLQKYKKNEIIHTFRISAEALESIHAHNAWAEFFG